MDVSSNTCIDIICDDENAEEVCFDEGFDKVEIKLKSAGQLDNIKRIYIGESIKLINIPNKVFPNVREVKSDNERYVSGTMLVEKRTYYTVSSDRLILLNSFCLREDEVLDLKGIAAIDENALTRCSAGTVINTEDVRRVDKAAFSRSNIPTRELPEEYNVSMVGTIITDVNTKPGFNTCVIPADTTLISRYKTIDGIVYSADMKTLIFCPIGKTGVVKIPDGVTRIRKNAFSNSKISKVILPDSMVSLQNEAFYGCEYLKEIDFGHGIEQIGGNGSQHVFSGCSMKKLVFPPQIKEIGINAFLSCGELEEVIFNEGLETIHRGAFKNCPKLTEINLPASIKKVGLDAFLCEVLRDGIQDVNVNMSTIPEDFGRAFIQPGNMQTPRCINVHIDNKDGIFDFVLPDCASAVTPGYSEIVSACNLMAGQEYDKKFRRLKSAFMYASNSRFKCVDAFKTYKKTKNESAKKYLSDYQKRTAEAIAMELTEKDFVDFLRFDFINLGYDKSIVKRLQEQNWNIALAYMLEEGREENNDALVI